jgi:hypothetical protein
MQSPGFFIVWFGKVDPFHWFLSKGCLMRVLKNKSVSILFISFLLPVFCRASLITTAPGGTFTSGYKATQYTGTGTLRGHVMLKNGLYVSHAFDYFTWDGDGVVNGPITWNNTFSHLTLGADLKLGSTTTVPYNGQTSNIVGRGNKIELGGDLLATNRLTVQGSALTIDGKGHTLRLEIAVTPQIDAIDSGTLTLKNMTLYSDTSGTSPMCIFGYVKPSNLILDNVKIICKNYGSFSPVAISGGGSLTIRGNVSIESDGGIVELSGNDNPLTVSIEKNSTLRVCKNTAFGLVGITSAQCTSFSMADQTSVLHLDGCDFYTSTSGFVLAGLNLTKGTVVFENKVRIFNAYYDKTIPGPNQTGNIDMTKGLILGDGTALGDVNVRMLGSAYVTVDGCMKYNHS